MLCRDLTTTNFDNSTRFFRLTTMAPAYHTSTNRPRAEQHRRLGARPFVRRPHPILRSVSEISWDFRRDLARGCSATSPPTTRFHATETAGGYGSAEWIWLCMFS